MINIGILDRHDLFRESLASLLKSNEDVHVLFSNSEPSVTEVNLSKDRVDLLIIDPCDLGDGCIDFIRSKIHVYPCLKVMVLTEQIQKEKVIELIETGISGIYSKRTTSDCFNMAINEITSSQNQFDVKLGPKIREMIVNAKSYQNRLTVPLDIKFSEREIQILELICREMTNQEISEILKLSVRTVESHRRRMIEKTNCKNMIGVVMYALENNLTSGYQMSEAV